MAEKCLFCGVGLDWWFHPYSWQHYAAMAYSGGLWPGLDGWIRMLHLQGFTLSDLLQAGEDAPENAYEKGEWERMHFIRIWNEIQLHG